MDLQKTSPWDQEAQILAGKEGKVIFEKVEWGTLSGEYNFEILVWGEPFLEA